jgi:hypothetical protein
VKTWFQSLQLSQIQLVPLRLGGMVNRRALKLYVVRVPPPPAVPVAARDESGEKSSAAAAAAGVRSADLSAAAAAAGSERVVLACDTPPLSPSRPQTRRAPLGRPTSPASSPSRKKNVHLPSIVGAASAFNNFNKEVAAPDAAMSSPPRAASPRADRECLSPRVRGATAAEEWMPLAAGTSAQLRVQLQGGYTAQQVCLGCSVIVFVSNLFELPKPPPKLPKPPPKLPKPYHILPRPSHKLPKPSPNLPQVLSSETMAGLAERADADTKLNAAVLAVNAQRAASVVSIFIFEFLSSLSSQLESAFYLCTFQSLCPDVPVQLFPSPLSNLLPPLLFCHHEK